MGRGKRQAHATGTAGYLQRVDPVALSGEETRSRLAPTGDLSWPNFPARPVPAEAHSDDWAVKVSFDAGAWLVQASDEELVALAREEWCNSYEADAVADFYRERETKALFDYLDSQRGEPSAPGFECSLDRQEVEQWLQAERPHLVAWIEESCSFATPHYHVVATEFISGDLGGSQGLEWEVRETAADQTVQVFYERDGQSEEEAIAAARQLETSREPHARV